MEHANKRVAEEQPQQPLAGRAVYQAGAGDADSDDDDETAGQQQPPPARAALPPSSGDSVSGEAMFPDESALNEEVERLMMALQGTSTTETAAVPETSCDTSISTLFPLQLSDVWCFSLSLSVVLC